MPTESNKATEYSAWGLTPSATPPRAWQRMLSGRRLDLLDPSPADIEIEDIAHGLARVARWNGQTIGEHAFSVAQHVLVVEDIGAALNPDWPARWRLAALLHDAPEYVIGDLISPFKAAVGLDYKSFELKLLAAIHRRFAIPFPLPDDVTTNGHQQNLDMYRKMANGRSIRETMASFNAVDYSVELVGTPDSVAARMGEVMDEVGGDGYLFTMPNVHRRTLAEIEDGLVPALQDRGLVRKTYEHKQFRDNLLAF